MNMDIQAVIWRGMAQDAANAAAQMHDPELRLSLLAIASSYEAMAKRAAAMSQPVPSVAEPDAKAAPRS